MNEPEKFGRHEQIEMATWMTPFEIPIDDITEVMELNSNESADQCTGNTYISDGSYLPALGSMLEYLGSWPAVATVICRRAQSLASFDPQATNFEPLSWMHYTQKLRTSPFWAEKFGYGRTARISSLSLSPAINMVWEMLGDLANEETFQEIVASIKKIASLAMRNEGRQQKDSYHHQGLIAVKSGQVHVGYVQTTVQMEFKSGKGYEHLTQDISICTWYGVLSFDLCHYHSTTIRDWDGTDIDDWTHNTNSWNEQQNNSPSWDN